MKVGLEFNLNGNNCIICDIKEFEGNKYANVCIEGNGKVDYRIFQIIETLEKTSLQEVKNEELLNRIMPLFIFDGVKKKEENMMIDKYLPIGTVVLLKGADKRVMITGFACESSNQKGQTFDYSGCLYPEGIINSNQNMLFNHNQIETIYFIGYNDEEERQFKEKLKQVLNEEK